MAEEEEQDRPGVVTPNDDPIDPEADPPVSRGRRGTAIAIGVVLVVMAVCGVWVGIRACTNFRGSAETIPTGDASSSDSEIVNEATALVEHYFPGYKLAGVSLQEGTGSKRYWGIAAESIESPGFALAFIALGVPDAGGVDKYVDKSSAPSETYVVESSGFVWVCGGPYQQWFGLQAFAGAASVIPVQDRLELEAAFEKAHPDLAVTSCPKAAADGVTFEGVAQRELNYWTGDTVQFRSTWSRTGKGPWAETGFEDLR